MPVIFSSGYSLPPGDEPLSHARLAHAGGWISGTVAASSTDASGIYFEDAPANDLFFEKWKPASLPATWELTPGAAATCDYCVIAAHNLGTAGAEFSIELDLGAGFVSVGLDSLTVADDRPIFAIFEPGSVSAARVSFSDSGGVPAIGFLRFGRALQMEVRSQFPGRLPFDLARSVATSINLSVRGVPLAQVTRRAGGQLDFSWTHLSEAWVESELPAFLSAIEGAPFVIADRPGFYPEDVAACWLPGERPRPMSSGIVDLHDLHISAEVLVDG